MGRRNLVVATLGFLMLPMVNTAYGSECLEQYFAPEDSLGTTILAKPHRELARFMGDARAGVAAAQRSLAVAYETGYLVSRCGAKAASWYSKAAKAGDEVAKIWVRHREAIARLQDSPECAGAQCLGGGTDIRIATFSAGPNGHYFAPVTINGVTVNGIIDTGASTIAMSEETARRFGLDFSKGSKGIASTANGQVANTSVVIPEVTVGGITLPNVRVSVGITGETLIGMSFLGRLNIQMAAGQLQLSK